MKTLHAKIGELTLVNDFFVRGASRKARLLRDAQNDDRPFARAAGDPASFVALGRRGDRSACHWATVAR